MPYNKYRVSNKADRTLDGIVFASKLEMNRYSFLLMMQKSGKISGLQRQVPLEILPEYYYRGKKVRAVNYVLDFHYFSGNNRIGEDCKGVETPLGKLKIKMCLHQYPWLDFYIIKDANEIGGIEIDKGVK